MLAFVPPRVQTFRQVTGTQDIDWKDLTKKHARHVKLDSFKMHRAKHHALRAKLDNIKRNKTKPHASRVELENFKMRRVKHHARS